MSEKHLHRPEDDKIVGPSRSNFYRLMDSGEPSPPLRVTNEAGRCRESSFAQWLAERAKVAARGSENFGLETENPGAPGSATGANETARESFLTSEYSAYLPPLTSLVWDRAAGSIERLELVRREGWA